MSIFSRRSLRGVRSPQPTNVLLATVASFAFITTAAQAQVTVSTTAFTGTATESFESFPNYFNGDMSNSTSIFGGAASLTGTDNGIYETSEGATFGLASNGDAQAADGTKGLGLNGVGYTSTITFDSPLLQFGGYFNAARATGLTDTVTFTFRDSSSAVVDTKTFDVNPTNTTSGTLNFYSFTSTTAFTSVSVTGDYVAMDGLQANVTNITAAPEPGSIVLTLIGGIGLLGAVARRRNILR